MSGYIDVYTIGSGLALRAVNARLVLAQRRGLQIDAFGGMVRPTPDRWRRRWQAEHTGDLAYLGATRAFTRTGAYLRHARRCQAAR